MVVGFPKASVGSQTEQGGSCVAFYHLASEVTQGCFSRNSFVLGFKGKGNGCQLIVGDWQSSEGCEAKNIPLDIFGKYKLREWHEPGRMDWPGSKIPEGVEDDAKGRKAP